MILETITKLVGLTTQDNLDDITDCLNSHLAAEGVTLTKTAIKGDSLHLMLEADTTPEQEKWVNYIRNNFKDNIDLKSIKKIKIYGKQIDENSPDWQEEFEINSSSSTEELIKLAQTDDVQALNTLINRWVNNEKITVKINQKNNCLKIVLEALPVPEASSIVPLLEKELNTLNRPSFNTVKIYGQEIGEEFPEWQQEFKLENSSLSTATPSTNDSGAIVKQDSCLELAKPQTSFWDSIVQTAGWAGGAITGTVVTAGEAIGNVATTAGAAIGNAALSVTDGAGYVLDIVSNSPLLKEVTKTLQVDWLINIVNQVDVVKAETAVRQLQQQYPNEKPSDIAHRIIVEKAMYAGGSGIASSLLPGIAVAMFAVDLAATTLLQAEMIYQIACAYGLDLKEPSRKGEIIAIFGLSLGGGKLAQAGGQYALKAGFGFLRNVPVAGAVIGASTNALMLYALGYGACRFYEAKINPLIMESELIDAQIQGENYLKQAMSQQVIMDQILVHLILAGNQGKTWETIFPELQTLNLSPISLETIAQNLYSPPSLDILLTQLEPDFARALYAQCEKVAQLDGVITSKEAELLAQISEKFQ